MSNKGRCEASCPYVDRCKEYSAEISNPNTIIVEADVVVRRHDQERLAALFADDTRPQADEVRELVEAFGDAVDEYADANKDLINISDQGINRIESMGDRAVQICKKGPVVRKRFVLFGERVVKCSSLAALGEGVWKGVYFEIDDPKVRDIVK